MMLGLSGCEVASGNSRTIPVPTSNGCLTFRDVKSLRCSLKQTCADAISVGAGGLRLFNNDTLTSIEGAFPASKAEVNIKTAAVETKLEAEIVQAAAADTEYRAETGATVNALVKIVNSLTPVSYSAFLPDALHMDVSISMHITF